MPCDARKTPYLVEKHGDGKKNVSKTGISIIKCISMRKKPLFADPNFVSGDLFTGASRLGKNSAWSTEVAIHKMVFDCITFIVCWCSMC